MRKIKKLLVFLVLLSFSFVSCTQNQRAKSFGGNAKLDLPVGEKLIIVTWKDDNLWTLTRKMNPNEKTETYFFKEESSFGMMEGNYTIIEHK